MSSNRDSFLLRDKKARRLEKQEKQRVGKGKNGREPVVSTSSSPPAAEQQVEAEDDFDEPLVTVTVRESVCVCVCVDEAVVLVYRPNMLVVFTPAYACCLLMHTHTHTEWH